MKRMIRTISAAALALTMIATTAACATVQPAATAPAASTGAQPAATAAVFQPVSALKGDVSKSLTAFSLDLFQRVAGEKAGDNVFLSPVSAWLALSMTYNGAGGATAEGFARALHASGVSLDDINADNAGLMGVLEKADPAVKIALANSIWMRKESADAFNDLFLDINRNYYAADIRSLDSAASGAADEINGWVNEKTNGNIKELVQGPIDPATVMFLINAVHFKAPWKTAFDPKLTQDGAFTTADGKKVTAQFLSQEEGNVGYADDELTVACLPYGGGRLEMVAVMPNGQPLDTLIATLSPTKLQAMLDSCQKTDLSLKFPKFKVEYEATLNATLKAMGMEEAFSANADFTAMSAKLGHELTISEVKQKAFIEVDEQGTEASAATSVEMRLTAAPLRQLNFDHPFVYLIRDTQTGAILFIGTMTNPAK